jgi:hypothetical protein
MLTTARSRMGGLPAARLLLTRPRMPSMGHRSPFATVPNACTSTPPWSPLLRLATATGAIALAAHTCTTDINGSASCAAAAASGDAGPRSGPKRVLCLHGINLNMFGKRDASVYGTATLSDINNAVGALGAELGVEVECFQTNHEGEVCASRMPRTPLMRCIRLAIFCV